jgi:4-azaleucine resistance transporter AzlC
MSAVAVPLQLSPRGEFWHGWRDMIPLIVGGVPFGIIYGALGVTAGIPPITVAAMSLFVFAGSSQFIAVGLVGAGASLPVIWLTTLVVNVRHALYSATLAPYVKHLPQRWLVPLAFMLTDESFVMAVQRYQQPDESPHKHWYFLGANLAMYVPWFLSTVIGIVAGTAIPDTSRLGLDFAMSATFIGMVIPMIKNRPTLLAVVVGGGMAILAYGLPNQLGLFVAALSGMIAGVIAESVWKPAPEPKAGEHAHAE